jgi:penicillin-binding protein 1A
MQHALQNVPVAEQVPPAGLSHEGGDWAYTEFSRGGGVGSLGMESKPAGGSEQLPANDEKKKILDLFKN